MLAAVRTLIGILPVSFGIGGRADALAIRTFDPIFGRRRRTTIGTKVGPIELDMRHQPQRFMAYCYHNLRRHYARSALGQYVRQLRPGSTFVDVGANLGFYSLLAREAGLRTVCFEPEPQFAEYLERNRAIFGQVFPVALSDENGSLPLYYFPGNSGATSLVPEAGTERSEATVPVKSFSELALAGELGNPAAIALIKIDVEGAEAAVVRGMAEFLAAGHRPGIWCEVRGNATGRAQGSFALVRKSLEEFGYSMLDAPESAAPGPPPTDEVLASRGVFDVFFHSPNAASAVSTAAAGPELAQVT